MARKAESWLWSELGLTPGEDLLSRLSELQGQLMAEALAQAGGEDSARVTRLSRELESSRDRLHEVRHRLRNQLQSVVGALSTQYETESSPRTRQALQSSIARLVAVAAVNDLLTHDDPRGAPLLETLEAMARQIVAQMGAGARVRVSAEGGGVALDRRQEVVLAMIAAELTANAVEHGFREGRSGTVTVRLSAGKGEGWLEVGDDGGGFPPGFDLSRPRGQGLRLVTRMARRDLGGEASASNEGGARVRVAFPRSPGGE